MNTFLFIIGLVCGVVGISVGLTGIVFGQFDIYAELTTGDIARFTPEQEYTFANIKNNVLVIKSNNTSSLSNEDIAIKVMDEFIRGGYTYCNDVSKLADGGLYCNDVNQDHTKQDKFFKEKYAEIVAANPNNPLTGLGKFFGFG